MIYSTEEGTGICGKGNMEGWNRGVEGEGRGSKAIPQEVRRSGYRIIWRDSGQTTGLGGREGYSQVGDGGVEQKIHLKIVKLFHAICSII